MHAAVFVLECCGLVASRMQSYGPAAELHQELLINYNPEVRPRLNPSEAVDVETILELNQLINVASKSPAKKFVKEYFVNRLLVCYLFKLCIIKVYSCVLDN